MVSTGTFRIMEMKYIGDEAIITFELRKSDGTHLVEPEITMDKRIARRLFKEYEEKPPRRRKSKNNYTPPDHASWRASMIAGAR